jgi:branched-chain amino acid transport system substrate-binding protein
MRKPVSFLLLLVLTACGAPSGPPPRVAVLMPLSGELAADGKGIERAVRLAFEEEPGVAELVVVDDGGEPDEAAETARRVAADPRVAAVIGHLTSGCSIAASKVYGPAGLAMVTPTATATELTLQQEAPGWHGARVVLRLPPSDAVQGALSAQYAFARFGFKSVWIVDDGTPYGQGLADEFATHFSRRGGSVAGRSLLIRGRSAAEAAERIRSAVPDAIFFGGGYPDAARLLKAVRRSGIKAAFLGGDGAKSNDLFELAGPAVDGAYFTVSGVPIEDLPAASDFLARYRKEFPGEKPRTFDAYGYVAAKVVLAALRRVGGDRARVLDALRQTDYDGMIGRVAFDGKGDGLKSLVTMTRADYAGRKFDPVY